jgi:hypothetical protein
MARRLVNPQQLVSLAMMIALLIMILTMRTQCATGTAKMFDTMAGPAAHDAGPHGNR